MRQPRPTVTVAVVASPFGPIHVAVDDRAVVALELRTTPEAFRIGLARRLGAFAVDRTDAPLAQGRILERAVAGIEAYLAGDPSGLELPVSLGPASAWDRRVLEGVRRIPFGSVTSYGRLARSIGARGAARAAGGAVGRNPIGLFVPCHRVIAGDGSLGGYGGSWYGDREELLELKRALLAHEGVAIPARSSSAT